MSFLKTSVRGACLALIVTLAAPLLPAGDLLFQASEARADVVSSIVVQGNSRIDADTIRTYVLITPGKSFGPGDVNDSVKALYDTGLFSNVRIDRRGNALVVTVAENPVVSAVRFKGNKKIKTDQLVGLVETKPRSMLSDIRLQSDVERIKGYYAHTGRAGAQVTVNKIDKGQGRVEVEFNISEGARTGIATIEFIGNNRYSDRRLRSVIETRQSNFLSWFTKRDVYSEQKLAADEELLRRFYMRNGYADFRVLSADVRYDEEKARYYIVITVDEGPKYKYGSVEIDSSISDISPDSLRRVLRIRKGQTFNADDIERTTEDLTVELAQRGYVFAQVRPQGDRDYDSGIIHIRFLIDEAARVYIERIDIRGNSKTRDYVIRREFDIAEGDPFNRVLIDKVQRRLRGMGLFKNVIVSTEPGSAPDRVVLVVTVEEDSTGEFSVAGGWSTSEGFIAEISISEKNFLGRGQYLRLSYGQGIQTGSKTYALAFTEPYFMGRRISAGFDLSRTETASMGTATAPIRPFTEVNNGGGVRLGLPVTENIDLQLNARAAQREFGPPGATPSDPDDLTLFPGTVTPTTHMNYSVGYVGTFSTIDNKRDPHEGQYFRLTQDFGFNSGTGATPQFVRTVVDARTYHEFIRQSDIVGMLQVQGGNIYGFGSPIALIDNFFKGSETIRGFAPYGIGPRTSDTGVPVGGQNFAAATAEVQFPLPVVPDDFGLRGAIFADAATLFDADVPSTYTGPAFNDGPVLRSSAGVSLLWASPFGLLRLDYAWPITQAPYDKLQPFRFGIGNQF
jgi:outer membrane protein insertion porin family